jgi:hypothetical protein
MTSAVRSSAHPPATFSEPTPYGYLYVGFRVDVPAHAPFVRRSDRRTVALERLTAVARELAADPTVVDATAYEAVILPPVPGWPRFDIVQLVRTTTREAIGRVRESDLVERLGADFVMPAVNARRIGDTEPTRPATFLFNHFTAPDPEQALRAWEGLTGWYTAKTGVDNSTILRPVGDAPYAFVNHVRLPHGAVRFALQQFVRPSFLTFVRATLREHGMVAMPAFYRPVRTRDIL